MIDTENLELATNKEIKSSAFTAFFGDAERAAALYRALEQNDAIKAKDIHFTTLSGVMFMAKKNDLAFLADKKVLVISEHQSTINDNMPLRNIIYYGRTMEKLIEPRALYRTKQIQIPKPEFYVFYNGDKPFPQEKILHLEDAYLEKEGEVMLKLETKVININPSAHHPLLEQCRPLYEYSCFIQKIKDYIKAGMERGKAILLAMNDCEKEEIMVDFIREHGTEASNMLFTEFNMEDALEVRGEEEFAEGKSEGKAEGLAEGILNLLSDYGSVPQELEDKIRAEKDMEKLSAWLKRAARSSSLREFEQNM